MTLVTFAADSSVFVSDQLRLLRKHHEPTNLPAGPSGRWLPTLKFIKNPRQMLERWRDHMRPFSNARFDGPLVVTGREELIREIHGADTG